MHHDDFVANVRLTLKPFFRSIAVDRIFSLIVAVIVVGCSLLKQEEPPVETAVVDTAPSAPSDTTAVNKKAAPLKDTAQEEGKADTSKDDLVAADTEWPIAFADSIDYKLSEVREQVAPLEGTGGMSTRDWINQRLKNAKSGLSEWVRLPLAHKSSGWACDCPDTYIGTDTGSEGVAWLKIEAGSHANLPIRPGNDGYVRTVEGYFTGAKTKYNQEVEDEVVDSFPVYTFVVVRSRPYRPGKDDSLALLLNGVETQRNMPVLKDELPWLAIVASLPYGTPRASDKIKKKLQKLKDNGFTDATYMDSRSAPKLFCCFHLVIAGRYATAAEAKATIKALKKGGFKDAYARQGW